MSDLYIFDRPVCQYMIMNKLLDLTEGLFKQEDSRYMTCDKIFVLILQKNKYSKVYDLAKRFMTPLPSFSIVPVTETPVFNRCLLCSLYFFLRFDRFGVCVCVCVCVTQIPFVITSPRCKSCSVRYRDNGCSKNRLWLLGSFFRSEVMHN